MNVTPVNPWPWSLEFGFSQGQLVEGANKILFLAGQTSVDDQGRVVHEGDMAAQLGRALANLRAVLAEAGMDLSNLVRLSFYTTDVDAFMESMGVLAGPLSEAGVTPGGSLLGVSRLARPGLLVELEAVAVA